MTDRSQPISTAQDRIERRFVVFSIFVAFALVALKTFLASDIKASAMFSDDYAYLNKSIYYIRGDWGMPGYIFQNVFAGILYPLSITPWMLFDAPETRIFVVFVINAVMSGVAVLFGSLAVRSAAGRPFWPAPLCIAAFTPMFLFSFVAMTENLVYPLLAITAWLCADLDSTLRSSGRLAALAATIALLPLVRAPGLAAGVAVFLMCAASGRRVGWMRSALCTALMLLATVVPYLIVMRWAPTVHSHADDKREAAYLGALGTIIEDPRNWWIVVRVTLSQLKYVLLATGGFALPVFVTGYFLRRPRSSNPAPVSVRRLRDFTLIAGIVMMAIIELHVIRKIQFNVEGADFIFGRYVDPIAFMVLIAGLATLPILRRARLNAVGLFIVRFLAPLCVALSVARVWNDKQIASFNQTGLAGFCGSPDYAMSTALAAIAGITILFQLPVRRRRFAGACVAVFLGWSIFSSVRGLNVYVIPRAGLIARSQEAATWLAENTPKTCRVGFDRLVFRGMSPTWRTMGLHYQALVFSMHPREYGFVGSDETMREFDFLFTSNVRSPTPKLPVAWTNGDYVLYRIVNDVSVYAPGEPMPLDTPASTDILLREGHDAATSIQSSARLNCRDLADSCCPREIPFSECTVTPEKIRNDRRWLTLAWDDSTVRLPICELSSGSYALQIRARADGCTDDMARLHVSGGDEISLELEIDSDRARCYSVPFVLSEPAEIAFTLVFTNNGECGPEESPVDKNIYIESLNLVPMRDLLAPLP